MVHGRSRKQRKEIIERYLAKHPDATLKEIGNFLGVSMQRAHILLKLVGLRTRRQGIIQRVTDREKEILRLIARGKTNKEIAEVFGVSHHTIKNQATIIQAKLNADNKANAVTLAIEQGYI